MAEPGRPDVAGVAVHVARPKGASAERRTVSKKGPKNRVAVYWDFENIHASLMDRLGGEGAYRRHWGRHPELVTFAPVMAYATSLGEVVVRRAYADWGRLRCYQRALLDASLEPVLTLTRPGAKNSADMRLVTDIMEDFSRFPGITHVMVLSGDGDFLPLAQKVRGSGRQIIGIGVQDHTSAYWREACSVFRDYEAVVGSALPSPSTVACKTNGKTIGASAVSIRHRTQVPAPGRPQTPSQSSGGGGRTTTTPKGDASSEGATQAAIAKGKVPSSRNVSKVKGHPSADSVGPQTGNTESPPSSAQAPLCRRYQQTLKKAGFQTLDFALLVPAAHCLSLILARHARRITAWSQLDSHLAAMLAERGERPTSQSVRWVRSMLAQGPGFRDTPDVNGSKLPDSFNADERLIKIAATIVKLLRRAGHWPIEPAAIATVLGNESRAFINAAISKQMQIASTPKSKVSKKAPSRKAERNVLKPKATLIGRLQSWLHSLA